VTSFERVRAVERRLGEPVVCVDGALGHPERAGEFLRLVVSRRAHEVRRRQIAQDVRPAAIQIPVTFLSSGSDAAHVPVIARAESEHAAAIADSAESRLTHAVAAVVPMNAGVVPALLG